MPPLAAAPASEAACWQLLAIICNHTPATLTHRCRLQEEEARRKARRKTKGRIRELEELRAELAEKVGEGRMLRKAMHIEA